MYIYIILYRRKKGIWMLMKEKKGLVMGVANDRSIAWGIAKCLANNGASILTKVKL